MDRILPAVLLAVFPVLAVVAAALAGVGVAALTRRRLARGPRGIAVPPPGCEAALAGCWAAVVAAPALGGLDPRWAALLLVLSWLAVAGSATDLRSRRLPDALTLPALPLLLAALAPVGGAAVARGLAGAALLGGAYAVVHLVSPLAMGAGDVKLAAPVGAAVTGPAWAALPATAVLAAVASAAVAALAVAAGRAQWRSRLPHGPVLLGAALAVTTATTALAAGPL